MEELKNCPFCRGKAILTFDEIYHIITCKSCPIEIRGRDKARLIAAWNTRAERTCEIVGFTSAVRDSRGLIEYPPVWNLSCGHEAAWWKPLSCQTCGAKVVE